MGGQAIAVSAGATSGQARPSSGRTKEAVTRRTVLRAGSVTSCARPLATVVGAAPAWCQLPPSQRQVSCRGPTPACGVGLGHRLGGTGAAGLVGREGTGAIVGGGNRAGVEPGP